MSAGLWEHVSSNRGRLREERLEILRGRGALKFPTLHGPFFLLSMKYFVKFGSLHSLIIARTCTYDPVYIECNASNFTGNFTVKRKKD